MRYKIVLVCVRGNNVTDFFIFLTEYKRNAR